MSFVLRHGSRPAAEMNVTPLIDVLLVLLVIFMIITPNDPHGLMADIPQQQQGKSAAPESPIVLEITWNAKGSPSLAINRRKIEWTELKQRLLEIYKSRADGVMFVKGDSNLDFEYVAQAIDVAHSANVRRVGLMP